MVATPMTYFAAFQLKTDCAVMITGSHNPPDYNGLKMVLAGETLSGETIQKLRQRIEQTTWRTATAAIRNTTSRRNTWRESSATLDSLAL